MIQFDAYAKPAGKKRWSEDYFRRQWQFALDAERKPADRCASGGQVADDCWKVVYQIRKHGELTAADIGNKTGLTYIQVKARLSKLMAEGKVTPKYHQGIGLYRLAHRP